MENVETQFLDSKSFPRILEDIDTFIFDADGVLWLGESVMPGSPALVDFLLKKGKTVIVLTNNATKSRAVYSEKLAKLGYNKQIGKNNIVNPAAVVADTLHRSGLTRDKKVYLIGTQGIKDELDDLGIQYFGDGPDPVENHHDGKTAFIYDLELEEDVDDVGAVVVGYERHFNYIKLMKAANYLKDESCLFVATNEDETCPGPNPNTVIPDAGPLVGAVKIASGREPVVVGKPNTPAFEYICRRWEINPQRTMMIGDRTNTDVKFGKDHGLKTCLVLSGCHQVEDIVDNHENDRHDMIPHFYAKNLGSLVETGEFAVKKDAKELSAHLLEKITLAEEPYAPQPRRTVYY
uniref:Putative phosphoglycolate/pyridoxal phosphate phosphatase family protein n=1 Tax=Steinernema ceratophorum TaxID=172739 RepID=A0A8F2Z1H9_9BILA|nr:putative phosphoglycolate/pyridoxal phosphate phosphatase family protein [Steinernema ceratophorum]